MDWSLITGRGGGGLQNGRGGGHVVVKFYPYEKGGRKNVCRHGGKPPTLSLTHITYS